MRYFWPVCLLVISFSSAYAEDLDQPAEIPADSMNNCLQTSIVTAAESMTVTELKQACTLLYTEQAPKSAIAGQATTESPPQTPVLKKRLALEALNRSSRFMLTPHRRNYFFPFSYTRHPNTDPYRTTDTESLSELSKTEADFQLSIKILIRENIFDDNGHLYLGYTNHSLWQLYSDTDSAPFRESNHQPELILSFTNDWEILGFRNALNELTLNHESNGQGGLLSRSWNRVMLNTVFERGNFAFALTPWYRIPEPEQEYPGDPGGDDNPDITDYMGNFELKSAYRHGDDIYNISLRNNLKANNRGALELGWTFPISSNLRGQLKYFNGYGHSLIDYNVDMEVFALGIVFTDLF
jgi:phospholipase A1